MCQGVVRAVLEMLGVASEQPGHSQQQCHAPRLETGEGEGT